MTHRRGPRPRRTRDGALALALASLSGGCTELAPAREQWLVTVSTDAPLPALGDRLLVEVLRPDGVPLTTGARRQLGLDEDAAAALPLSFGVVAEDERPLVRARLYRALRTGPDGLPDGTLLLDAAGVLPGLDEQSGVARVSLPLFMRCFGVAAPSDLSASCSAATGELAPIATLGDGPALETGTWPEALPAPCARTSPPGAVCVPGGVFFLGGDGLPDGAPSLPERLAQLAPFHLDTHELTVGEARSLAASFALGQLQARGSSGSLTEACRFTTEPAESEDVPLNCVTLGQARELCEARGGRLPTEAEWEYVASDGALERTYPFGEDDLDLCAMAAVGRGRSVQELTELGAPEVADCRGGGEAWGPVASGDGPSERDVTLLGVRDLGGNVSEWVEGRLGRYDDPCWGAATLLVSPTCTEPALYDAGPAIRGGSWLDAPFTARAVTRRTFDDPTQLAIATGVRCAYDD